jgi:uncharacterized protein YneF (UPF0154 family)
MPDLSLLIVVLILFFLGLAGGWFWHRARSKPKLPAQPTIANQLTE